MKTIVIRIEKSIGIYLFFSVLFFIRCGAPEDNAIPPVQQDGNLKTNQTLDTSNQLSEKSNQASGKKDAHVFTVDIQNMAFVPATINVHKGDIVVWNNHDMVTHCVSEDPGKGWTSSEIKPGDFWKMVVTKSSNYFCAIHMVMKGKIVVE